MSTNSRYSEDEERFSAAILALFPHGTAAAVLRRPGDPSTLLPEESAHLGGAVPKRAREFAAGRQCARLALAGLGIHHFAVRVAPDRQPLWPDSVVGSISHTQGLCTAVVADRRRLAAIGIDCETVGDVTNDIRRTVCSPSEEAWIESLPPPEQAAATTLVFSAKEAFYKCQYPLAGEWLEFHDLAIEPLNWGAACGDFIVSSVRSLQVETHVRPPFPGRYVVREGYLIAGVALTAPMPA